MVKVMMVMVMMKMTIGILMVMVMLMMMMTIMIKMMMENLLSCALSVHPEPDGVDGDADHGGARHDVAESMSPPDGHHCNHPNHHHLHHQCHHQKIMCLPWIVITLVDDVLPSKQLKLG